MKILLIIDTKLNSYHSEVYADFENALVNYFEDKGDNSLEVIDIGIDMAEHEMFDYILKASPDLIITIDFAGFNMKTTGGAISYNCIPCRMAHVLLRKRESYSDYLTYSQNFSMFTYIPRDEDINLWTEKYPWITNIGHIGRLCTKHITAADHDSNIRIIEEWLPIALKDMRYETADI